jgi:hypothetical protein
MEGSGDHPTRRSTPMWNLTSYDIHRIKGQLQARRARIDAKYAEDTKALDADFADLETLERVAAVVALKYKAEDDASNGSAETSVKDAEAGAAAEADVAAEPQSAATLADESGGLDTKVASRWRLALRERPSISAPE